MFVNLTPHPITLVNGPTIAPSGSVARCSSTSTEVGTHEGVTLVRTVFGAVTGLPEPTSGTVFIVSALVRTALPGRTDLASPGDLVRDEAGNVVGCRNLIVNSQ